jgi:hypothetical protein
MKLSQSSIESSIDPSITDCDEHMTYIVSVDYAGDGLSTIMSDYLWNESLEYMAESGN